MTIRPIVHRPELVPGESLPSLLLRTAAQHETPTLALLHRVGLVPDQHHRHVPRGLVAKLTDSWRTALSETLELSPPTLDSTVLEHFHPLALDHDGLDGGDSRSLRTMSLRNWAHYAVSPACPSCLREAGGAWMLSWRLALQPACPRHRIVLQRTCPGCGQALGRGRTDGSTAFSFLSIVPSPTRCANPRVGAGRTGRGARPCGHDLTAMATVAATDGELAAHNLVSAALGGAAVVTGLGVLKPAELMADLRSVMTLTVHAARPAHFMGCGPETTAAVLEHANAIGAAVTKRRPFLSTPGPTVAAALLTRAADLLLAAAPDAEFALNEMVSSVVRDSGRSWSNLATNCGMSNRLTAAIDSERRRTGRVHRRPQVADLPHPSVIYIPAAIAFADYRRLVAQVLPAITEGTGRRGVAVLAGRLAADTSMREAAAQLGSRYSTAAVTLAEARRLNKLDELLGAVGELLSTYDSARTDYGALRSRFADLGPAAISEDQWSALRPSGHSDDEHFRRSAASWIWSQLTGGHPLDAPAQPRPSHWQRFETTTLPSTRQALRSIQVALAVAPPKAMGGQ